MLNSNLNKNENIVQSNNSYNNISVNYHSLDKDDEFSERQFSQESQTTNKWGTIIAFIMFFGGIILITIGILLLAGITEKKHNHKAWALIIIGTLIFLPGIYYVRIALLAWRRVAGYTFDDIPSYC